jgi:putative tributyrin esterase
MKWGFIMALIHCDFFSEVLGVSTSMCVILPQNTKSQIGMGGSEKKTAYPTLYLLHGLSDDHTVWQRRTSIERYVASLGIAVVMPAVGRSFYTDMKYGYKYFTFISEELPEIARSFFPLSDKREDNFVAGLSMGGYGAYKIALTCPDKFAAAASLSGAVDIADIVARPNVTEDLELINVFGDLNAVAGSNHDIFHLVDKLDCSNEPKPKLYQCCGTEDFLYDQNVKFKNYMAGKNFDFAYEEEPGMHEWGYWDNKIQRVLEWLPLQK